MKKISLFIIGLSLAFTGIQAQKNALHFDGVDDYVSISTIPATINFSNGFSFVGWIRYDSFKNWSRIFDFGDGENSNNIYLANYGSTKGLEFHIYDGAVSYQLSIGSTNAIVQGEWVHLAATVSSTGLAKIYINGVMISSVQSIVPPNVVRSICYLGKSNSPSGLPFHGAMDYVSFWNIELSSSEVNAYMVSYPSGGEYGLYANYYFDQGTANGNNSSVTILNSNTSYSKNGTLNNFALSGTTSNWIAGKVLNNSTGLGLDINDDSFDLNQLSSLEGVKSVSIISLAGKTIWSGSAADFTLNRSSFAKGLYIVNVVTADGVKTEKVMIR